MTESIKIDADRGWDDLETQVIELETAELLAIYDMFAENPSLFQMVADELLYRKEHDVKIASTDQFNEIIARQQRHNLVR